MTWIAALPSGQGFTRKSCGGILEQNKNHREMFPMKQQLGRAPGAGRKAARTKRPTTAKAKSNGHKAARTPVVNPGGYRVLDGTAAAKGGKPPEVGRIVRAGGKFEAWRKVEGGYVRVGAFEQSHKAIDAVGAAR